MSRENSPLIVGDYWLDKRRDGKSPHIWQIATYSEAARSIVYRSTKRRTLDEAGAVLRAHEAEQRSKERGQDASHAELLPHLFNYLREHGPDVKRLDTVKSSFRAWIGFLMQDELGTGATVADVTKSMVARFRRWRMAPHAYAVEWNGKLFKNDSSGVTGETVQRNIEDLRSALHHGEAERRIVAPRVPSVDRKLRSDARDTVLTTKQLGAMLGYAKDDIAAYRWIALMIATASRPGPALAFDPEMQWHEDVIDLQPEGVEESVMAEEHGGVAGDYHDDANALARKAWRARERGTGMRLNADEVIALHIMQGDGDWWASFSPSPIASQESEQ
jgi:hypothetical protein